MEKLLQGNREKYSTVLKKYIYDDVGKFLILILSIFYFNSGKEIFNSIEEFDYLFY